MAKATLKERQKKLVELFHKAPISINTGMRLHYNSSDQAVFELPHNPKFDHALEGIHGGIIPTGSGTYTATHVPLVPA